MASRESGYQITCNTSQQNVSYIYLYRWAPPIKDFKDQDTLIEQSSINVAVKPMKLLLFGQFGKLPLSIS